MKKTALLFCVLLGMPLLANAGVSININTPGVSISIGDRDNRGYYWDGYDWRAPKWWHAHHGKRVGERGPRGDYWNGNGWQAHAPKPQPARHDNGPGKQGGHGGQGGQPGHGGQQGQGKGDNHQRIPPQEQRH